MNNIKNNFTVFVVVEIDRSSLCRTFVDNQDDVEVKAVFTNKQNAEKYVSSFGINRNLVIHETVMNPILKSYSSIL